VKCVRRNTEIIHAVFAAIPVKMLQMLIVVLTCDVDVVLGIVDNKHGENFMLIR
jgi:hypothetical protein